MNGLKNTCVTIPYVSGVSNNIKSTFRNFGIVTSFKPYNTLRQKLVNVKEKPDKEKISYAVYGIKCLAANCSETHVGETQQALGMRMWQYKRPSTIEAQNSAVFNHLRSSGHTLSLHDVKVLDKEETWLRWGIKEAAWERVKGPSLSKKGGLRFVLSHTCDRVLQDMLGQLSRDTCIVWSKLTWQKPEEGCARWPKLPTFIIYFVPVSD